jgi:hypothetical protein
VPTNELLLDFFARADRKAGATPAVIRSTAPRAASDPTPTVADAERKRASRRDSGTGDIGAAA